VDADRYVGSAGHDKISGTLTGSRGRTGMRIAITSVVLVCASIAHASPYRDTHGVLERIDNGHATLTFVVRTESREPIEVAHVIELPVGMTPTSLTVSLGGEQPITSDAYRTIAGKAWYEAIVAKAKDPALLEYVDSSRAKLRVFPVRRGANATVVIALTATSLARANQLVQLGPERSFVAGWMDQRAARLALPPKVDDEGLGGL
jgi:hypothetical protein